MAKFRNTRCQINKKSFTPKIYQKQEIAGSFSQLLQNGNENAIMSLKMAKAMPFCNNYTKGPYGSY
ncbi:MAG: hypothetical protein US69_C0009G0003 [candidate division TM6 bacterium GW2011_GWF2_38_10]|nr:MAG: hypothetical protein US69_C0009G0003 [candidate division TM6 bacterium GW2011_GWF2_38_10]